MKDHWFDLFLTKTREKETYQQVWIYVGAIFTLDYSLLFAAGFRPLAFHKHIWLFLS